MSSTYGGWNPEDPYREQDPGALDPYGPRDPYGRPANPYGRPDYYEQQRPQQGLPQQGLPQYVAPVAEPLAGRTGAPGPDAPVPEAPATVGAAWRWAWGAFGASWGTWVLMSIVLGIVQAAVILAFSPSTMAGLLNATDQAAVDAAQAAALTLDAKALGAAGTAVCFLLQALLYAGALAATRTRTVRLRDFFLLRGVLGLIGYAVIVGLLGFIGTAVPMVGLLVQVVFTLLLLPVPFLLLKGIGLGRSIGKGITLVLSHIGAALAVFGIFAGLAIASVFTCGLGLIVVGPVMLLVGAALVERWSSEETQG